MEEHEYKERKYKRMIKEEIREWRKIKSEREESEKDESGERLRTMSIKKGNIRE